jgi:hypothetical protein
MWDRDVRKSRTNFCKTLYSWNAPKLLIISFLTDSTLSEDVLTS